MKSFSIILLPKKNRLRRWFSSSSSFFFLKPYLNFFRTRKLSIAVIKLAGFAGPHENLGIGKIRDSGNSKTENRKVRTMTTGQHLKPRKIRWFFKFRCPGYWTQTLVYRYTLIYKHVPVGFLPVHCANPQALADLSDTDAGKCRENFLLWIKVTSAGSQQGHSTNYFYGQLKFSLDIFRVMQKSVRICWYGEKNTKNRMCGCTSFLSFFPFSFSFGTLREDTYCI